MKITKCAALTLEGERCKRWPRETDLCGQHAAQDKVIRFDEPLPACPYCGGPKPVEAVYKGYRYCSEECFRLGNAAWRKANRAAGLCPCGAQRTPGYLSCSVCRQKKRASASLTRRRRAEEAERERIRREYPLAKKAAFASVAGRIVAGECLSSNDAWAAYVDALQARGFKAISREGFSARLRQRCGLPRSQRIPGVGWGWRGYALRPESVLK